MDKTLSYFGWIGKNNLGDEAIYAANSELFSNYKLINQKYIDSEQAAAALFPGGTILPKVSLEWSLDELPESTPRIGIGVGIKNPDFWNRRFAFIDLSHHLRYSRHSDLLRNRGLRYLLAPISYFSEHFEASDHYLNESEFENLKNFSFLGVRGPISSKILEEKNVPHDIVGDTALILEPDEYHNEQSNSIIITLRDGGEKWTSDTTYRKKVIKFCKHFENEYKFVFLPHTPSDIPLHLTMSNKVANSEFIDCCSYTDIPRAINIISESDLVIGEKLHANVLSACTHTPFLSLEYQDKNKDFALSIGKEEYNKRIDEISIDWLHQNFQKAVHSTQYRDDLENEVRKKRDKLQSYASTIASSNLM